MRWIASLFALALLVTSTAPPTVAETPLISVAPDLSENGGVVITCLGLPPAAAVDRSCAALGILDHAEGDVAASLLGSTDGSIRLTERAEMANDGHMVLIDRFGERVFEVRVFANQELTTLDGDAVAAQYATVPVDIAAPDGPVLFYQALRATAPCDGPSVPVQRCHPAQSVEVRTGPDGTTYLRVTVLDPPYAPMYQGFLGAQAIVTEGGADQRVEGYYTLAKLALPLDAFDAVADVVRIA